MKRNRIIFLLSILPWCLQGLISGCAAVKAYEREYLAQRIIEKK